MVIPSLKILHFSDLHYGRITSEVVDHLKMFIDRHREDIHLIVFTGDFTQRAKTQEFKAARQFLDSLDIPFFIVPGNHDVPLYNLFLRFLFPYRKYKRHLGEVSPHFYEDEKVAIYGLWTVDNFSIKDGKVKSKELSDLKEKFSKVPADKVKIIACHHPLNELDVFKDILIVHPHMLLWGHEHQSRITHVDGPKSPLIIAAGTTTSSRLRKEANSFNLIQVDDVIRVMTYVNSPHGFELHGEFKTDRF